MAHAKQKYDPKTGVLTVEIHGLTEEAFEQAKMSKSGGSLSVAFLQFNDQIEGLPNKAVFKGTKISVNVIKPLPEGAKAPAKQAAE